MAPSTRRPTPERPRSLAFRANPLGWHPVEAVAVLVFVGLGVGAWVWRTTAAELALAAGCGAVLALVVGLTVTLQQVSRGEQAAARRRPLGARP